MIEIEAFLNAKIASLEIELIHAKGIAELHKAAFKQACHLLKERDEALTKILSKFEQAPIKSKKRKGEEK